MKPPPQRARCSASGAVLRKRFNIKLGLIRAKKNRQEKIDLIAIEIILDKEFLEFQRRLNEQIERMNEALDYSRRRVLPEDEAKEIKRLYRLIVKALHPDLHPNVTPEEIRLFHQAVRAYEDGDLMALQLISEIAIQPAMPEYSAEALSFLNAEKERLGAALSSIREQIVKIKSEFPYTMKDLVDDPKQIAEKRAELENTITNLKEAYDYYAARIEELLM